jgi:diguanylate cyclase (GGDEF)-like protein/PAS domain S-box-containing protein
MINQPKFARNYQLLVIAAGGLACFTAATRLSLAVIDIRFLFIALVTLTLGSRITVEIPRAKGTVSVSDTFIFLVVLLLGDAPAVMLAAADGLVSSLRANRKPLTFAFNSAAMALSTFCTASVVHMIFGPDLASLRSYSPAFIGAVCVLAMVQYIVNSWLVAVGAALKKDQGLWHTWKTHFLWTSITYIAGASAAGIIAKLIETLGFYAFLATTPIIAIIYFTYSIYLKNVEVSIEQAEQAERHVTALKASEARFRSAFDHAAGMAIVGRDGRWLKVNKSLCRILGYKEEKLLKSDFQSMTHPEDLGSLLGDIKPLVAGESALNQIELRFLRNGGDYIWVLLSVSKVQSPESSGEEMLFQIQDITDRKEAEERLVHNAFHDVLTGLPNRALFKDHLGLAVNRSRRAKNHLYAVLFLDLDRFKVINDSLGHLIGDQLLVGIARRLESSLRPGDTVARLGGDEFTVLLEDLKNIGEASEIANRLQDTLSAPFTIEGREVYTTVSIGIALSTIGYEHPEDVLRDADTAMYRAKMLGKDRHEVFDKAMHARALNLLQLETDLRRAVERSEFELHFQPIVALENGRVKGFEALLRWHHADRGYISPIDFIPIAEETGLIVPIGQWVLEEACRQIKEWQDQFSGFEGMQVSVNLSSRQFALPSLCDDIRSTLSRFDVKPRFIKLEITESMMMQNVESAINMLNQLRSLGLELSMDDFGTGYSSLSYLRRFPISTLKIDRSFVSQMSGQDDNAEIVRTIIMLANNLDLDVIAEGIETMGQLAELRRLKCQFGQGYFFSKPLSAIDATQLLAKEHVAASTTSGFTDSRGILEHLSEFIS